MSLNLRLILSASLVLTVFIALTGAALDQAFQDSARAAIRDRMLGQLYLLMAEAEVNARGELTMSGVLPEPQFALVGSGLYGFITNAHKEIVWRSRSALAIQTPVLMSLSPGERRFLEGRFASGKGYFLYGFGIHWTTESGLFPFTFHVISERSAFHAQVKRYRKSLWGWLGVMSLALLLTQILVLRWGLQPLRRVSRELTAIEAGQQDQIQGDYPQEIERLTDNINALLEHERARQTRYRNALADLAHSLKTPLAVLRGVVSGMDNHQASTTVLNEQIERMNHIVAHQLQRAATTGASSVTTPIVVRPLVEKIIGALNKVYRDKGIESLIEVDAALRVRADGGDLMELLGNVIENAYKWGRHKVRIRAWRENKAHTVLVVEDDGPGIAADKAQQILERGARADQTVPGHGIGLAIVVDILQAYDGEMYIGHSELGGAEVRLSLPG